MDYSLIRGFNYQPSYGSSGFEIWQNFSAETIDRELGRGKRYFPGMNAIRLWLSMDSFNRDNGLYLGRFETALRIAHRYNLLVMPVLFNRWHDPLLDYGGVYADHFLPGISWAQNRDMLTPFVEAVVGSHADDPRVFSWDLCNEPFAYQTPADEIPELYAAERNWLQKMYDTCKRVGAKAPVTVGTHIFSRIQDVDSFSDLISIHPYWTGDSPHHDKGEFERMLDGYMEFARSVDKPLLATETCWGSLDDAKRVEYIRYTLGELKKRRIGWLAYLLHHSLIADAHRLEYGPLGIAGNLSFIEADGSLRPGHEVFNEFD